MNEFEDKLHDDLHQFLLSMKEVDERFRKEHRLKASKRYLSPFFTLFYF